MTVKLLSKTKEYKAWQGILYRCTNPKYKYYLKYSSLGGGIQDEWKDSFHSFLEHIGPAPDNETKWSVGRIDNSVGYVKGNVRWETPYQQNRNRGKTCANSSGETGVVWKVDKNRTNGRAIARWYDLKGNNCSKSFGEGKYGKDGAMKNAAEYRQLQIDLLKQQGAEYGERHGY